LQLLLVQLRHLEAAQELRVQELFQTLPQYRLVLMRQQLLRELCYAKLKHEPQLQEFYILLVVLQLREMLFQVIRFL
jgi:hypothetical protein